MSRSYHLAGGANRAVTIVLVAIAAAAILYLGIPRTIAAFIMLPDDRTLRNIRAGEAVEPQRLEWFVTSRRRALAWIESGRVRNDLGLAELLLALPAEPEAEPDQERIGRASGAFHDGLSSAPASPHAWTRLAYAEMLAAGPSSSVASALTMSMLTARYEPDLLFARLELCLINWSYFSRSDRDQVLDQVRIAWRQAPDRLVKVAIGSNGLGAVRAALARTPKDLSEFEQRLRDWTERA